MADETAKPDQHEEMQPADAPTWQIDIADGAEVYTSDGHKLGTIKEIAIGYFKVDVHLHGDYWLQRQFVTSNEGSKVTMSFTKDQAKDYEVKFLPDSAVAQGQDLRESEKGDALGDQVVYTGGAVPNPEMGGTNPASATIRAAEREYNYRNRNG
jgi:hypothetical protein